MDVARNDRQLLEMTGYGCNLLEMAANGWFLSLFLLVYLVSYSGLGYQNLLFMVPK